MSIPDDVYKVTISSFFSLLTAFFFLFFYQQGPAKCTALSSIFNVQTKKKKQASFETADLRLCQCPCFSGGDGSRKEEEEKKRNDAKLGK